MEGRKVRLRLRFERRRMLPKLLRHDGLRRCWLLLRPGLATIADLSCYIFHTFQLQNECPNGIILAMEDFILPSFESTCIFKDKDTISVRSTDGVLKQLMAINDINCCGSKLKSEKEELNHQQNKCSLYSGMLLLGDASLREVKISKRKDPHQHVLCSSKRKKLKVSGTNDQILVPASADGNLDQNKYHPQERVTQENLFGSSSKGNRNMEENFQRVNELKDANGKNKSPLRNFEVEKHNLLQKQHHNKDNEAQLAVGNNQNVLPEREILGHSGEKNGQSIHTMIGNCHNHYEENNCQQGPKQALLCDGTFSKHTSQEQSNKKTCSNHAGESYKTSIINGNELPTCQINFEDLYPLTRLPKEGDILVYRLFQSSQQLGPELSSFRVGKVSSYDVTTTKIVLEPISGYPPLPNNAPYKADGLLEIDYPELVDVRLLNNEKETPQVSNMEPGQGSREYEGWANNKAGQANAWGHKEGQEISWGKREEQQNFWGGKEGQQNGSGRNEGQEDGWGTKEAQANAWDGNDGRENGWDAWPRIQPRNTSRQDRVDQLHVTSQMRCKDGRGAQRASASSSSGQRGGRGARGSPCFRGRGKGGRGKGPRGRGGRGGHSNSGA